MPVRISPSYVERACTNGLMPVDIAIDLVVRLTVQHRNESCGRGIYEGSWMSPRGEMTSPRRS